MNNYLFQHYKGQYRVLADYDTDTNDFPRDESGNIDESFNDFYIPGKKGLKIVHAGGNELGCWAEGTGMGNNILKAIYELEFKKPAPKKAETVANKLIEGNIIVSATFYDGELLFTFKTKHLDSWAKIFKLKHNGANISPLSSKNLPKSDYQIPEEDEAQYAALFPQDMKPMEKAVVAKSATTIIKNKMTKKQIAEMKQLGMKPKQYIHYIGKWDKFIKVLEKEINNG